MSLGFKTIIAVLTLSLSHSQAVTSLSCGVFIREHGWTFVKRAEKLDGDQFTEMVIKAIDWAHPPSITSLWRRIRFSTAVLEPPNEIGPDYDLIAQLSRFQQMAHRKHLSWKNIETINIRIMSALNSFGGNGLGQNTGLWVLGERSPQGISDMRAKDLRNKEHDYLLFVFRDWKPRPASRFYDLPELKMQLEFAAAIKNREEKFELYLEAIENASNSLNEEGYIAFAIELARSLTPEFMFGGPYVLSTPKVVAIFSSLRTHSANHFFKENTLFMDGDGFISFQRFLIRDRSNLLWRDSQTRSALAEIVEEWEREISNKIHRVKLQYLRQLRPMPDEDVVALRSKFQRIIVQPKEH